MRLEFAGAGPVAAYVADYSYGLPTTTAALVQARPAAAVPIGEGDLTVIWRRIEF